MKIFSSYWIRFNISLAERERNEKKQIIYFSIRFNHIILVLWYNGILTMIMNINISHKIVEKI